MLPTGSCGTLECCLHGKACRASLQHAEELKRQVKSFGRGKLVEQEIDKKQTRQKEAIDRLANHLMFEFCLKLETHGLESACNSDMQRIIPNVARRDEKRVLEGD
ncbi:unnamed protein product [Strongylus vulgaris]|uniref:Uncharacterized protein n=1 Tax=Strongylus vulgaris TaxID=40348 RepID=A0A3P7KE04_STRVU|nr:unnamed protein product [Strongylus vulgaris]